MKGVTIYGRIRVNEFAGKAIGALLPLDRCDICVKEGVRMNIKGLDAYGPCFCGSGRKLKFCCGATEAGRPPTFEEKEEMFRLMREGNRFLGQGLYKEAIPSLEAASAVTDFIPSPANNLAYCLFVTGDVEKAFEVQRKSFRRSPFPNAYGVANLALFNWMLGREDAAEVAIRAALQFDVASVDTALRICEVLAHMKRHQAILDYIDGPVARAYLEPDPSLDFYSGVAAANLGDSERAIDDLRQIGCFDGYADLAMEYGRWLYANESPKTPLGDWPYMQVHQYGMQGLLVSMKGDVERQVVSSRFFLDFGLSMLHHAVKEKSGKTRKSALDGACSILKRCMHPDTEGVLREIAAGSFGTKMIRTRIAMVLGIRDEATLGTPVDLHLGKGKKGRRMQAITIKFDSSYVQYPPPPEVKDEYEALISVKPASEADWAKVADGYDAILRKAPDYVPAQFNRLVALKRAGKLSGKDELKGYKEICTLAPNYLFARAAYLLRLCEKKDFKTAETLIQPAPQVSVAHPLAYRYWVVAQVTYYLSIGDEKTARSFEGLLKTLEDFIASENL